MDLDASFRIDTLDRFVCPDLTVGMLNMHDSLTWLQKLELKKAVNAYRKAAAHSAKSIGGVLFIPPPDATNIQDWLKPVQQWLNGRPPMPVRVVIGQSVSTPVHDAIPFVTVEPFTEDQIKKHGSPRRDLKHHMLRMHVDIAILLNPKVEPTSELLFASVPAKLKAAVWAPGREQYSTFLYHPQSSSGLYTEVKALLEQLDHFQGGGLLPPVSKAG